MKIKIYDKLSDSARIIREEVFMKEQGFQNEFDEIDDRAKHIVLYTEEGKPVATCRIFKGEYSGDYILGRLAVRKEYRGKNIGATIVEEAERCVKELGGNTLSLHAQCRVSKFYQNLGFSEYGEADEDEGCPHIWMKKVLSH
ncbi:MAG: GNAT family N-acetyltransferase [Lachnospiraceae bacterium]|nr:GNAT family N-acetyltransferase [Lachnospiraceae bacterium]